VKLNEVTMVHKKRKQIEVQFHLILSLKLLEQWRYIIYLS